jgi:hypothetical protein
MRYELSDYEWTAIKPMLPNKPRGVPRVNDRRVELFRWQPAGVDKLKCLGFAEPEHSPGAGCGYSLGFKSRHRLAPS